MKRVRRQNVVRFSLVALVGLLLPLTVEAQQASGIVGVVSDTSGAVLPGVTVEAASSALIEKVRTVVTDSAGRYNIVDLRPGTYAVTFSLSGFKTARREGIQLTSGFTATVDAGLEVGALEETVTVTGASPLVDTRNVQQAKVVSRELLATLPSGGNSFHGIIRLIPGMTGGLDSGGASGLYNSNSIYTSKVHGKGSAAMSYDGMQAGNLAGSGNQSYILNPATVEEVSVETGGISAETDSSGIRMNLIPKEGSNLFKGSFDGNFTNEHFQGDNLSDRLRARGVTLLSKVLRLYDANVTVGGRIKRDRLWFFTATRFSGSRNTVTNVYFNATRGTPLYTPDLNRPAFRKEWLQGQAVRLTWQISAKNKLNGFADIQSFQQRGQGQFIAPESVNGASFSPGGLYQASWSAPMTAKLLFEAAASLAKNPLPRPREKMADVYGFVVASTDVSILDASTGFRYNAGPSYSERWDSDRYAERFSVSYITGAHSFKSGFTLQEGKQYQSTAVTSDGRNPSCPNCPVDYIFLRPGVPSQITLWATPYLTKLRVKADLGFFAQDQWVIKRVTMNYGLRFDYMNAFVSAQHVDAGEFVGVRDFAPVQNVPNWTDLNPRLGVAYDLLGDNRTALKASLGRYVGLVGTAVASSVNPITTSVNSVTRTWTDDGNYIPDCDLRNFAANGECGAISNVNFGKLNPTATQYADELIHGFGNRSYLWDFSAEVQHQLTPAISIAGGYNRSWTDQFANTLFGGMSSSGWPFGVTDNSALTPSDFETYCITAPVNANLPGGGGYQVCGLYDVVPAKFGLGTNVVQPAANYGNGKSRHTDFFTVSVATRFGRGIEFGGSLDTGHIVEDNCYVVDSPQQLLYCHVVAPFKSQTQIKAYWRFPLPGAFVVSGVFQNLPGVNIEANYAAPTSVIAPSLGRNLAACGTRPVCTASASVPLYAPWTQFDPRHTVLDMRLSRLFSLGSRLRLSANLDGYNLLNDSAITVANPNYGSSWRQPLGSSFSQGVMSARLLQFSGRLTFVGSGNSGASIPEILIT